MPQVNGAGLRCYSGTDLRPSISIKPGSFTISTHCQTYACATLPNTWSRMAREVVLQPELTCQPLSDHLQRSSWSAAFTCGNEKYLSHTVFLRSRTGSGALACRIKPPEQGALRALHTPVLPPQTTTPNLVRQRHFTFADPSLHSRSLFMIITVNPRLRYLQVLASRSLHKPPAPRGGGGRPAGRATGSSSFSTRDGRSARGVAARGHLGNIPQPGGGDSGTPCASSLAGTR